MNERKKKESYGERKEKKIKTMLRKERKKERKP